MGMVRPTDSDWKVVDTQYLYHKAVTSIALENGKGQRIYVNVSDEAFEKGSKTAYFPSHQAKESPQTDDTIVGAGTDFLMKVTEEAVISGMILSQRNGRAKVRNPKVRDVYRRTAEDITLEELRRFTECEAGSESLMEVTSTALHREGDRDGETDDAVMRAAHGIPAPMPATEIVWGPPRPADRYAPHVTLVHDGPMEYEKVTAEEYERYLDETKGPSS